MCSGLDADIVRLYREEGLSTRRVAQRVGWSESYVLSRLVTLGVPRRLPWAAHAVTCDVAELVRLYVDEGLTLNALAEHYRCSMTTVWRKLTAAGVQCREGGTGPRYARQDFSTDPCEQAYLIGFRIGDLNVELEGHTIVVKCTSTQREQIDLFRELFERYGYIYTDEATLARRKRQSNWHVGAAQSYVRFPAAEGRRRSGMGPCR